MCEKVRLSPHLLIQGPATWDVVNQLLRVRQSAAGFSRNVLGNSYPIFRLDVLSCPHGYSIETLYRNVKSIDKNDVN